MATHAGVAPIAAMVVMADLLALLVDLDTDPSKATWGIHVQERVQLITYLVASKRAGTTVSKTSTNSLSSLVRDVATCCENTREHDGFWFLKRATNSLVEYHSCRGVEGRLTKQIALDAALSFAQISRENEHLAYARDVESRVSASYLANPGIVPKDIGSPDVRWEEGLCEWVLATPWQTKRQAQKRVDLEDTAQPSPLVGARAPLRRDLEVMNDVATRLQRKPKLRTARRYSIESRDELGPEDSSGDELVISPMEKHFKIRRQPADDADDEEDELSLTDPPPLKDITNLYKAAMRAKGANKKAVPVTRRASSRLSGL